jgi:hypothetical protein
VRPSALTLALVACSSGDEAPDDTDTQVPDTQVDDTEGALLDAAPACLQLVDCLLDVAPDTVVDASARYGEGGDCWTRADRADLCARACGGQLAELWNAFPDHPTCLPPDDAVDDVLHTPFGDRTLTDGVLLPVLSDVWGLLLADFDLVCSSALVQQVDDYAPTDRPWTVLAVFPPSGQLSARGLPGNAPTTWGDPSHETIFQDVRWHAQLAEPLTAELAPGHTVEVTVQLEPGQELRGLIRVAAEVCPPP